MKKINDYFHSFLQQYKVTSYLTYTRAKTLLIFSFAFNVILIPEYILSVFANSLDNPWNLFTNSIYHFTFFSVFFAAPFLIKRGKYTIAANSCIIISMINLILGTLANFNNDLTDSAMPIIVIVALSALLSNRILTTISAVVAITYDTVIQLILVPWKAGENISEIPSTQNRINHFLIFIISVSLIAFILNLILKIVFKTVSIAEEKNIELIGHISQNNEKIKEIEKLSQDIIKKTAASKAKGQISTCDAEIVKLAEKINIKCKTE